VSSNAPVRVRLRYAAFDTFIEKFAPNVTRGGVFLASKTPFPVGTVFAFELQLAGGEVALAGDGKVTWVKPFDPAQPQKAHGMGVQFLRLDAPSRETLNRMLARKTALAQSGAVPRAVAAGASGSLRLKTNGTPIARVDTTVDLAAELGIDESRLRRASDRHRIAPGRATSEIDELEALLKPEPIEPAGIAQALAELPRLLDPGARRMSGPFRPLAEPAAPAPAPPAAQPAAAKPQDPAAG
jgi:molecular chaperone DnaK